MKGLKILNRSIGDNIFTKYFNKLICLDKNYYWIINKYGFHIPITISDYDDIMENMEKSYIYESDNYVVVDMKFMDNYSCYISNDWNEVVCLNANIDDIIILLDDVNKISGYHNNLVSYCIYMNIKFKKDFLYLFENVDGAIWYFICLNEKLVENLYSNVYKINMDVILINEDNIYDSVKKDIVNSYIK